MTSFDLTELYKQIKALLAFCYEHHRSSFKDSEKEIFEMYLNVGEYELALDSFVGTIEEHKTELDEVCLKNIKKARKLMGLQES